MLRTTALALVGVFMAACTGTIVMSPLGPDKINTQDINGIIVYRAIPRVEVDQFIQINVPVDPKQPNSPMVLSDDCTHFLIRKIVSIADSEHPFELYYHHGWLEAYSFAATLNGDGILTSINTTSTPDQGKTFQNIASGVSSIATAIPKPMLEVKAHREEKKPPEKQKPNCTVTSVFVGYEELPKQADIKPFGKTPTPLPE